MIFILIIRNKHLIRHVNRRDQSEDKVSHIVIIRVTNVHILLNNISIIFSFLIKLYVFITSTPTLATTVNSASTATTTIAVTALGSPVV